MRGNSRPAGQPLDQLWRRHHEELRDPHQIAAQWQWWGDVDPQLLAYTVRGDWWDVVARLHVTLLVSREYEHLLMGFSTFGGKPRISYFRLPHPSGMAVDSARGVAYMASTRNPNAVFEFGPCAAAEGRDGHAAVLAPRQARYLPGRLYLHDLAMIGGRLHANAAGLNAVVQLPEGGGHKIAWWPKSIESPAGPRFDKNYLQVNSIAAGPRVESSFFSASAAAPSARRPGHLNFPVDGRGVVFSGKTGEVVGTGLTRPHSARLVNREIWVDNSGYGQLGRIVSGRFESVHQFSGWTRGLCVQGDVAFVGTSRVIPRYRRYAPGLNVEQSECGLHAFDMRTGCVLGSLLWPAGNQIFAIEAVPESFSCGFPYRLGAGRMETRRIQDLYSRGLLWAA